MKITLYAPDGTAETFVAATTFNTGRDGELGFEGVDWCYKRRKILTTLQYRIEDDTSQPTV